MPIGDGAGATAQGTEAQGAGEVHEVEGNHISGRGQRAVPLTLAPRREGSPVSGIEPLRLEGARAAYSQKHAIWPCHDGVHTGQSSLLDLLLDCARHQIRRPNNLAQPDPIAGLDKASFT